MARKRKSKVERIKEAAEKKDLASSVVDKLEIEDIKKSPEQIVEEKDLFQTKVDAVAKAINSEDGKKLALRIKIYNNTCHIYQGLFSNTWGRINYSGTHTIYRHALTNLLKKHPDTKDLF